MLALYVFNVHMVLSILSISHELREALAYMQGTLSAAGHTTIGLHELLVEPQELWVLKPVTGGLQHIGDMQPPTARTGPSGTSARASKRSLLTH